MTSEHNYVKIWTKNGKYVIIMMYYFKEVNFMQKKLDIMKSAQTILEEALKNADNNDDVIYLGAAKALMASREDAEVMLEFLQKYSKIESEEEFENAVKEDYDQIPYIIGATDESEIGKFQAIIESIC